MAGPSARIIRKAVFINPYPAYASGVNEGTVYPPIGIAYIAAVLERKDIECRIIDAFVHRLLHSEIVRQIRAFKPDLIGITSNIVTARAAVELGSVLRKKFPGTMIVFGGPYATAEDGFVLKKTGANAVVRGEGELTIAELVDRPSRLSEIKGISYRRGIAIKRTPPRDLIEDLDSIPFPAYHLLPDFRLYKSRSRKTPIGWLLSTRGCPYGCIYCNKNIFGRRFRQRSTANVLTEIELLVGRYGVKQIDVLDDNFTLDIGRAERVFDEIIRRRIRVLINFQNGIRADRLTPELVRKMKLAGVYKTGIGIESGDPEIQKIIKKSLMLEKVKAAIRMLRKEKIIVIGFFMIGIPGETGDAIQKTIDFAREVNPHIANFSVVVPLPQTEMFEMVKKNGRFLKTMDEGSSTGFYSDNFSFEYGDINTALITKYTSKAYREFYLRPSKMLDVLTTIRSWGELRWIFDTARPLVRFLCK